jgi:uncharacterized membrane protein
MCSLCCTLIAGYRYVLRFHIEKKQKKKEEENNNKKSALTRKLRTVQSPACVTTRAFQESLIYMGPSHVP